MASRSTHERAIEEVLRTNVDALVLPALGRAQVQAWLSCRHMEDFIFSLADNGYDDLSAMARATDAEAAQLLAVFQTEASPLATASVLDLFCCREPLVTLAAASALPALVGLA